MAHTCPALVFRCMDFRIKLSVFSRLLEQIGYPEGTYDLVSAAGSAKDLLATNQGEVYFLFKQIELSQRLHQIKEVVIIYHDNCGAYGITDPSQEHETQSQDLERIKRLIETRYQGLIVKTYIIKGVAQDDLSLAAAA